MPISPAYISLMSRYPTPGVSKTRLIPELGEEGAARVQREMAEQVARQLRILQTTGDADADVWITGATAREAYAWLRLPAFEQPTGTLDVRMRAALDRGLRYAHVSAVVGADCPTVDAQDMRAALRAAAETGISLIPASDGGFCLLAISRERAGALPDLFADVAWGTETVLASVLANACRIGVDVALLPERSDIDEPHDLPHWHAIRDAWRTPPRTLAIVIPTLNEEATLPAVLERVIAESVEVVIADGGSTDGTLAIARDFGVPVVTGARGRGAQMNRGAASTTAEALLFLHADSVPQPGFRDAALATLSDPSVLLGAFEFSLGATTPTLRMIERNTNWRSRARRLPYGDQGLFLRRVAFDAFGGFAEEPALEDLLLVEAARRAGAVAIAPMPLVTSDRRWREMGVWGWTALNLASLARHRLGASPADIAEWRRAAMERYSKR